eukprot:CAMPEP_0117693386 /NCGR_PEP_ID=MMETSP0804-20121206/26852_1 /TAXON_ID=1074897 /ORGANISM="Tetraselmis astigmatica, Strain CCMP880" /LENGTH=791 /DNA_ID=CAMNT_0005506935 /DNA_START=74 /DNA_END=2449 /DNA_ORIENTATION=+
MAATSVSGRAASARVGRDGGLGARQSLRTSRRAFLGASAPMMRPVQGAARVSSSRGAAMDIRCEKVVGIDLGTTNSAVAAMEGGKPTIVTNAEGARTTPSVVAYSKTGDRLVGQIAKRQAVVNPTNTFFSVKRFVGRRMEEVKDESTQVPYVVKQADNGTVKIECPNAGKDFSPEEISASVLRKLIDDAGKFLNDKVEKAVITVPAYFNDSQRQATKGGTETLLLCGAALSLSAPTTCCLSAHKLPPPPLLVSSACRQVEGRLAVVQGCSSCGKAMPSLLLLPIPITVSMSIGTSSSSHSLSADTAVSPAASTQDAGKIAGIDVLRIINEPTAASLAYGFEKKSNETILVFDLGGGTFDVSILEVGDGVFEVLSTSGDTHLGGDDFDKRIVDFLAKQFKADEGIDLLADRQALQRLTEAAEKAKVELSSTTQTTISLPFITATAEGPKHIDTTITRANFEKMCSDLLDRCKIPVQNALKDADLTLKDINEVILVGGSTRIPAVVEVVRSMTGKAPNATVNPDEVVALGAAVQAGVLAGEVSDIVLLDVTPLSLGLETLGGVMTKLIPRNTTLPTSKSEVFSTAADGQTSVEINVLQGEREFVKDNKSLGNFRLDGIPSAPRGVPQIEVKFDIDANGILSVSAMDKGSNKRQEITITGASTLSEEDVEKMVKDAEANAEADKAKREAVDTKNQADSMVYQTEKQLTDLGDKVQEDMKKTIEGKVSELKDAIAADDVQGMKDKMEALQKEVMAMGQAMYQGAEGAPGAGTPPPAGDKKNPGDDVVDADFTDAK